MKTNILASLSALALALSLNGSAGAANDNGSGGDMPAFYDGELLTINFMELPSGGEQANIQRNGSINTIYMSDPRLPGRPPFFTLLDPIQGEGFNPLGEEVQMASPAAPPPRQLLSDNAVLAAAAAGEITLTVTGELYRCSVVGPK